MDINLIIKKSLDNADIGILTSVYNSLLAKRHMNKTEKKFLEDIKNILEKKKENSNRK